MSSVLNYFGYAKPSPTLEEPPPLKKSPVRALPAPWYTSREMYECERRAIFSRKWLFITHRNRLQEPGDFLRYTVAGFDFIITLDRNHTVNALHNVCRHRAYSVVEQKQGRTKILACRYHGWSYGLDGRLAKAPNYQELDGFDKTQNGLFPIHVHIDTNGFIWVNMDSRKEKPEVSWEDDFENVDKQERFQQFKFDDYVLDHSYELEGGYNWKILADNFNECYHCKTTHPDVPNFLTIDSADVDVKDGHMQHDHASTPEQRAQGFNVNSTYYFPNASMSISPHFMMIQKFLPDGPTNSAMHYEVYRNKNSGEEEFSKIADTYARVMSEDKVLCSIAQKNINAGVFINGQLHPKAEKGPLYFQNSVRKVITEHYHREKAAGHEIWPARQQLPSNAFISQEDLEICEGLACGTQKEELMW
ncbi:hypothetical protein LTR37_018755 [Vermiconidia calcicola]|uniref:Uncharacterized protein n=1 Tax=Vermiconidia calcicola TaxID=1690605 RepID=A0ACC3MG93_9PEZI|nr:hypothetical protein LTR37_018755 [Vermiconidia calcicola]